ncbi:S1C family serine protease [Paenibacillus sp.]|uniref:S1C family serine protease n=1 Tax=Paenibacillus sp. TaxID=58172 RepID=UPI002D6F506D|nr:trypsin-like peptidase domain-containing protein [Paenibacillus sp.]HZG56849.1 trypsin-like peptidase domain-containing protein [Paenibacillus sp.]
MNDHDKKDKDYHYFTYGRVPGERSREDASPYRDETREEPRPAPSVEMTPPRELRTYPMVQTARTQPAWSYNADARPSRRSPFRSVVASFLAGALVVGSLMFASDKMNLFSGSDVLATGAGGGGASTAVAVSGANGAVTTAAMDVVRPNTIAELVDIASPAVVKIQTYATQRVRSGSSFFDQFFEVPQQPRSGAGQLVPSGSGSGFFFDKEGYILTNEHVINGAEKVEVVVEGTKEPYVAKVLGTAYDLDLAVLKIEGKSDFPTLPLGSSDSIRVGDWVVAIGNPYEFDHTVTVGVLSAKEREIAIPDSDGTRNYQALLQTDASINPGNSGGPLLNLNGEVIGINTAVNSQAQGIGFAIPTSTINDVLESLKANKAIPRPYIGIGIENVPEEFLDDLKLSDTDGAFVTQVLLGTPAYEAGIQQYDVIVGIDGKEVKNAEDLMDIIGSKKPGDKLAIDLIRNGQKVKVTVTVGDRNDAAAQ